MVDDEGGPVVGTFVRVLECCHTERGPCGRVPVDTRGQARLDVCPGADGLVHVTLTPDARRYRVAPIREVKVVEDTELTVTVTRHTRALERYAPSSADPGP